MDGPIQQNSIIFLPTFSGWSIECLADTCLTNSSGIIMPPRNEADTAYKNNLNITWYISLPLGQQVSLSFLNFAMESCPGCR